jgi:beta-glucanase (GH16 family)
VGFEETGPADSGEICIAELYGHSVGPSGSSVRTGLKAHHDSRLHDDMADIALAIDATDWHTYAAAWTADTVHLYVDDQLVRSVDQGLAYPMQLMVDLFEFPADARRDAADYPRLGDVSAVRGYLPVRP